MEDPSEGPLGRAGGVPNLSWWNGYHSIYVNDVSGVYRRHGYSKERGIRAVLNSIQNRYEHRTSCASHMPAQKTAVNCDATSLPCHVGLGMDDE